MKKSKALDNNVLDIIKQRKMSLRIKREWTSFFVKIFLIAIMISVLFGMIFGIGIIHGEMMYPMLRDGDVVMFYRFDKTYVVGDILAVKANDEQRFLRVCALGGDTVDFSDDGKLMVNGNICYEDVFFITDKTGRKQQFPMIVKDDELFVLGDNRQIAEDSRDFGAIQKKQIKGKLISLLLRRRGL